MHGELVTLRTIAKGDSKSYFRWINDRELVIQNGSYRPISEQEHEIWFNNVISQTDNCVFSIVENQNNTLIGSCSLRNINQGHKNAELQIRIGEHEFQNKGMGSEAVKLLVKHGFTNMDLKRIYLYVFCSNVRAIKAYEKCLFNIEGTLRKAAYIEGNFVDMHLMSILNF